MVAVLGKTGRKLMPASEYRARKLLAKGRVVIDRYDPFTIRLTDREEQNLAYLKKIMEVVPVTSVTMEMGQFDTQILLAMEEGRPLPEGTDYQHGARYGVATLREAVFSRDNYTCQCCGKGLSDGAILHVHHLLPRSEGGTNRLKNLITVCDQCHTPANHKPGGKLWHWKPAVKSFAGATFMTAVRWMMYREVKEQYPDKEVRITYGAETKERRRTMDIHKSHVNDAYVMGNFHPKHRCRPVILQKKRRNNRILEKFYDAKYLDSRDGKKKTGQQLSCGRTNRNHNTDSENLHSYRQRKLSSGRRTVRKHRYPIQPHDTVRYKGRLFETAGCQHYGQYLVIGGKSVSVKKVRLTKYSGRYYQTT